MYTPFTRIRLDNKPLELRVRRAKSSIKWHKIQIDKEEEYKNIFYGKIKTGKAGIFQSHLPHRIIIRRMNKAKWRKRRRRRRKMRR